MPYALRQNLVGIVVGLGLHVLRQRERDRAGVRGAGEHAHGGERRGHELLRAHDAIPITRHRLEGVVHADVAARWDLELLQHRIREARREHIARQQKNGQAVHGRERGAGEHVRRARADRRSACEGLQAILLARVSDRAVDHRLLVPRHVVREQLRPLKERLAYPGDVAVAKDAPHPGEEALLDAVALDVLRRQESHERLRHRESRHAETFRASTVSISASVGIASAQARREATIAPAAFAASRVRRSGQPARRPWQRAPPKASPAPSPLSTGISTAGTATSSRAVRAYTPSPPRLTIAISAPISSTAAAPARGSRVAVAISTSSVFPTTSRPRFAASRSPRP